MATHVHLHLGRKARDSFEESKHPRASNGQFGAGVGKTHAEHAAHHEMMSQKHAEAANNAPTNDGRYITRHTKAEAEHDNAAQAHRTAEVGGGIAKSAAHGASKMAHSASMKAPLTDASEGPGSFDKSSEADVAARQAKIKSNLAASSKSEHHSNKARELTQMGLATGNRALLDAGHAHLEASNEHMFAAKHGEENHGAKAEAKSANAEALEAAAPVGAHEHEARRLLQKEMHHNTMAAGARGNERKAHKAAAAHYGEALQHHVNAHKKGDAEYTRAAKSSESSGDYHASLAARLKHE